MSLKGQDSTHVQNFTAHFIQGVTLIQILQNFQYLCHKPNSHYREQCLP